MKKQKQNTKGFYVYHDPSLSPVGTCLQGEFRMLYREVKARFGQPLPIKDGYKTDAEWTIKTPAGTATIYNWKDGKNYLGKDGLPKTMLYEWHIGGATPEVVPWVITALGL